MSHNFLESTQSVLYCSYASLETIIFKKVVGRVRTASFLNLNKCVTVEVTFFRTPENAIECYIAFSAVLKMLFLKMIRNNLEKVKEKSLFILQL